MLYFCKLIAMSVGKEISFTLPKIPESKADPLYFPPIYSSRIYDVELIINLDFPIHNGGVNGIRGPLQPKRPLLHGYLQYSWFRSFS